MQDLTHFFFSDPSQIHPQIANQLKSSSQNYEYDSDDTPGMENHMAEAILNEVIDNYLKTPTQICCGWANPPEKKIDFIHHMWTTNPEFYNFFRKLLLKGCKLVFFVK